MNNSKFIDMMAGIFGVPRKQVTDALKKMSAMPEVQEELKKMKNRKKGK